MVVQPVVDAGEDEGGTLLPYGESGGRIAATDVGLDGVEIADWGSRLPRRSGRDRRG